MKNTKSTFLLVLLFLSLGNNVIQAQVNRWVEVDKFAKSIIDSLDFVPGFAVGIIHDGEVVFSEAYGYSDVTNKSYLSKDSQFYIASTTKSFTALSAVILDRKGLLDLNSTIKDHFPSFDFPDSIQADRITIKHLLSHTSGLDNGNITYRLAQSGDFSYYELYNFLSKETFGRLPLGTYRYSNLGYNILNLIYLKRFGKDWKQIVQEEILTPLSMKNTYTDLTEMLKDEHDMVTAYNSLGDGYNMFEVHKDRKLSNKTSHAAGGLYSSLKDVVKWLQLQTSSSIDFNFQNIIYEDLLETRIQYAEVKPATFGFSKYAEGYGLGWNIGELYGHKLYFHGGAYGGQRAMFSFIPDLNIGVVTLSNDAASGNGLNYYLGEFIYGLFKHDFSTRNLAYEKGYNWIQKFKKEIYGFQLDVLKKGTDSRAKRTFHLSVPLESVCGIYFNNSGEAIRIYQTKEGLEARSGDLLGKIEPFLDMDTLRLFLTGPNIASIQTDGSRVLGFNYRGDFYSKM